MVFHGLPQLGSNRWRVWHLWAAGTTQSNIEISECWIYWPRELLHGRAAAFPFSIFWRQRWHKYFSLGRFFHDLFSQHSDFSYYQGRAEMIDFQFVHVDASSAKARKRNHQLARAHSARTHRRKRCDELVDITVFDPSELSPITVRGTTKDTKSKLARTVKAVASAGTAKAVSSTTTSVANVKPSPAEESSTESRESGLSSPSRTLSPMLGAISARTFDPGSSPKSEHVAHYCKPLRCP